ncbi:unnamed protein product, partial [Rotaria magnacalcarata]
MVMIILLNKNNRLYQLAVKQFLSNQQIKTTMNYME